MLTDFKPQDLQPLIDFIQTHDEPGAYTIIDMLAGICEIKMPMGEFVTWLEALQFMPLPTAFKTTGIGFTYDDYIGRFVLTNAEKQLVILELIEQLDSDHQIEINPHFILL